MASVLYFGTDDRVPKLMDQFFQDRLKEAGESNSISVATDEKKLNEFLIGMSFEIILAEQGVLGRSPNDWLTSLRKMRPAMKSPLILIGVEHDPAKIMKFIEGGWTDYIILPPDKPLLIEKVWMYAHGSRSSEIRQVYSMSMSAPSALAKPGFLEELSEFDCKMRSNFPVPVDDLLILTSPAFGPDGNVSKEVLGRCYNVEPHKTFDGQYINSFYFVGITPENLVNVRNSLRKQFVSGKAKP